MRFTYIWESLTKKNTHSKRKKVTMRIHFASNPRLFLGTHDFLFGTHDFFLWTHDFFLGTHDFLFGTHDFLPTTHDFLPTTHDFLPTTHDFLPTTHDFLPTTHDILPTTHDILPTTHDPRLLASPGKRWGVVGTWRTQPLPCKSGLMLDFLKVRFGIRTFPACFARFLPTYIVVGGWPWCDWGCVIILANEKRIFK